MISVPERGIYLASRSPRRRELLAQIGVRFHLLLFRARPGEPTEVDETPLAGELAAAYIAEYVESGESDDKAGAYAIQGRAARFVMELRGSYSGVMGLPLYETAELLDKLAGRKNAGRNPH